MANLISQKSLFIADPTEGFVQYTQSVKPYHTKILEILVEYVYHEDISVSMTEKWRWNMDLTRPNFDVLPMCGYGVIWDNWTTINDYSPVNIIQSVGDTPIEVVFYFDLSNPTHILVSNNPDGYVINVNDPVTFQTTGMLPTTATGPMSPGLVYYVCSVDGSIIELSTTISSSPIVFVDGGTGTIKIHQENLKYNSFLVEQPVTPQFECTVSNPQANQLSFASSYNVVQVIRAIKTWIISGHVISAAYQLAVFSIAKIGTSSTGLLNNSTVYTAQITVDGTPYNIAITGSTAQTFTNLLAQLNIDLNGFAIATLENGSIRIQSNILGATSNIDIQDGLPNSLFGSLTNFDNITPEVNDTVAIPGTLMYVHHNSGNGTDGTYTIVSAVISGANTVLVVEESISNNAQNDGIIYINYKVFSVPHWYTGTKVKVSSPGTLPTPLSASEEYFFIPNYAVGTFNLSMKQKPKDITELVDITSLGVGAILNIQRADVFYPGAVVDVTNTHLSRNNGRFYVRSVEKEGAYARISTLQKVVRTTPPSLVTDGVMTIYLNNGYDYLGYCGELQQAPELYTSAFIDERITFEFVVNFNDYINPLMIEDNNNPFNSTLTVATSPSYSLPTMGFDTQFFDMGVLDEDTFFDSSMSSSIIY